MGFDVGDGLRLNAGIGLGHGDDLGLALDARRSITDLERTVVVDGASFDDRANVVTRRDSVGQSL